MLFVGDDWAQAHHDVELMNAAGRRLAKARRPEGVAGIARLQPMIVEQLSEDAGRRAEERDRDRPRALGVEVEPIKVVSGVRKTLIWERTAMPLTRFFSLSGILHRLFALNQVASGDAKVRHVTRAPSCCRRS